MVPRSSLLSSVLFYNSKPMPCVAFNCLSLCLFFLCFYRTAQEMKRPVALNPFAKEFVPTKQVCKEDESLSAGKAEAAPVTNSNESE